mgnify:CR=1 FL=1
MAEPTVTVARCYQTRDGWFVTVKGRAMAFPIDAEVPEGASVRIIGGRAVRP